MWVIIQDPADSPQIYGLEDNHTGTAYIPVFYDKEEAMACFMNMPRRDGVKYEVQAMAYEELAQNARENNFVLYFLDGNGRILERIDPIRPG